MEGAGRKLVGTNLEGESEKAWLNAGQIIDHKFLQTITIPPVLDKHEVAVYIIIVRKQGLQYL